MLHEVEKNCTGSIVTFITSKWLKCAQWSDRASCASVGRNPLVKTNALRWGKGASHNSSLCETIASSSSDAGSVRPYVHFIRLAQSPSWQFFKQSFFGLKICQTARALTPLHMSEEIQHQLPNHMWLSIPGKIPSTDLYWIRICM